MIVNKILNGKDLIAYGLAAASLTTANWLQAVNQIQELIISLAIGVVTLVLLYFRIKSAWIDLKEKENRIKNNGKE
jgi:phosphate/sulfate permease